MLLHMRPFTEPVQNPEGWYCFTDEGTEGLKELSKIPELLESPTVVCTWVVCLPEPGCVAVIPACHYAARVTCDKTVKCIVCHLPSAQQHRERTLTVHLTVESRGAFLEEVAQLVSCFS